MFFALIYISGKLCQFATESSFDGSFNITTIKTTNPYIDWTHCWALFTCPAGFIVEFYFDYFLTEASYDVVWLTGDNFIRNYDGGRPSQRSGVIPDLYQWISTGTDILDFQFRADGSNVSEGFKLRLRCARESRIFQ